MNPPDKIATNPIARTIIRPPILALNRRLAKRRLNKVVAEATGPLKLEIGGLRRRPGWVVTNISAVTPLYLDATVEWPLDEASLDAVYADNVIEHVPLASGRVMYREALRCLRPGGVLRVVTPDLGKHIDQYMAGCSALDGEVARAYRSFGLVVEHPVDLVQVPIAAFKHYQGYVYDAAALRAELEAAGFTDVVERDIGQSDHAVMSDLDIRGDEGLAQMAFDAVKPG